MSKKLFCLMSFLLVLGMVGDARSADEIYFTELFDDGNFSSRGWYDNTSLVLSTTEHIPGSTSSVEYHFLQGATTPTSGGGIRKLFTETETVYLSFYIKHSTNWTGSNQPYHPHEFHFMTNLDGAWGGLASTYSTYYIEENEGEPQLALQDSLNIDESNIGVDLTGITEYRAIAGCNGNSDGTGVDDCYLSGSTHRNGKTWEAGSVYFQDSTGPYYKSDWHFIEAYFQLNSIVSGVGIADGQAKYWYDGELIINQENLILRTGENPNMKLRQFIIAFWIGDGSPVDQTVWVDDLTVANYRVGSSSPPGQASSPSPTNSATDISISADLSWTAGSGATSHDVYFGTDSTPDSGEFQSNQAGTTFDPGTMANDTTYYWRIDEVNAQGTTTGNVWNFTTETAGSPPGQASNPSPANSATNVSVNADLSWTAGSGSDSSDVYFGTDPTPDSGEFIGNQPGTNYNPGTLENDTTYYWRIDELNAYGTTTGTVWNFTTAAAGATVLLVDFGGTQAENSFGLAGWNTVIKDTYTDYRSIGPGGTTIVTGQNPEYDYQGVTGSSRDFVVDEKIVVTWYNNSASQITFTPRLSFTDSDRPDAGWYSMSQTIVTPYGTNTSEFVLDAGSAGTYSLVNINCYYTNNQILICDKIELITGSASPGQAANPSPADSATSVSINADLSWTAGSGTTSHDVYFGTSSPGSFQGNQTAATFDPGTMANNTAYYWRIDELNAAGTTTGTVWSFTTIVAAPAAASSPSPANSATDVSVSADLSWTAGAGATSHNVYFGTTSPGSFQGNQTAATFEPGTMANNTTYYWRIDELNAAGTTTGTVWSFTTVTAGQPVTEEFGDATNTDHPGTIEDTFTNQGGGGTGNYSTDVVLSTYTWPADTVANTTIIKWDISSIPTDVTITEATLYLYQVSMTGDTSYDIGVHKIINVNPVITSCNWNTYDGTNSWTGGADGGQGDTAAAEDTQVVNSTNNVYKTWTVTNMVANWVSTPSSNYGMLVNSDDVATVDSCRYFASTEVVDAATRPKLIVSYISGSPGQATSPDPADSAADVTVDAVLSWTAGSGATSHDVYFGSTSPGAFQGNQTQTTFDPGTLSYNITYYWRIDEVNASGTTPGDVWSFTTEAAPQPPGQATNPSPADSATNVGINADLSWTAGSGSTSSDVYFGTSSPGTYQGNQTETSFDPGAMANDTTYYWRIDEINADGTTTGSVWSFTTVVAAPAQASNPSPANSATNVGVNTDLSWTAGSGATSHDVYFGTDSTPDSGEFQGNQTAATFEPGTMANDTTYYWRIDEVNAGGTTTGAVWNFTTEAAPQPPGQASSPDPADSTTDVSINADLSWTAGSGSTSSDVYFGTTSPGTFQGNQTATTFDPGTMDNDTTYYWRIDEINAVGTTTGNVWSFTTVAGGQVVEEFGDAANTDNPGTIEDTYTNQGGGGTGNYSTDVTLNTYTWPADTVANTTIIKWDLSSIPTSATVTEATLYLYQLSFTGDTSYDIGVHKIINVNPVISALTWNTYDGTNSWTGGADGGQGDTAAAEDTQVVDGTNNVYKTWTVANMVADWVSTPSSNYGMLVNSDDVATIDSCRYFASNEVTNAATRPKLIVTYTTGAAPPGQASNPSPANSATDVSIDADLSWTAGSGSTSSDGTCPIHSWRLKKAMATPA